jgi:hypothetical protein
VPSGGARRGRRDNGLVAAEYAAVGDVDPRVGEHLLDMLGDEGIAAYLQPATDLHPVTRTTTVPARPVDRLYVDREHLSTGREYLTQLRDEERDGADAGHAQGGHAQGAHAQGGHAQGAHGQDGAEPADMEAEFARIVAGFDAGPASETPPWPAAENVSDLTTERPASRRGDLTRATDRKRPTDLRRGTSRDRTEEERPDRPGVDPDDGDEPSLLDALDTFGADLPDEPDDETDRYTPPPAPPLPRLSRAAVVAMLSMVCGLGLLFFPDLLPVGMGTSLLLGFGALLVGFLMLVWRLRPGDDEDSDSDDGAVV